MISKKWFLITSLIAIVCFIAVIVYGLTLAPHGTPQGPQKEGRPIIPTYILSIAAIILIIALLPLFYYVIYRGLEKNFEQNMKILSNVAREGKEENNTSDKPANCANVILNFLSYNEKKIVNKLIEQNGSALQSEISRMESMGKVKTHRAVKDMERRGIIITEKYGNTNRINLTEELKKIFLK